MRKATEKDLDKILYIYNQAVEDKIATLDEEIKDISFMKQWLARHNERYVVMVGEWNGEIISYASLNRYSERSVYNGVADLSIYIQRDKRGLGIGSIIMQKMEQIAQQNEFYKILLLVLPFNELGMKLYEKKGYREVGVFHNHGIMSGKFVDVAILEKIISDKPHLPT